MCCTDRSVYDDTETTCRCEQPCEERLKLSAQNTKVQSPGYSLQTDQRVIIQSQCPRAAKGASLGGNVLSPGCPGPFHPSPWTSASPPVAQEKNNDVLPCLDEGIFSKHLPYQKCAGASPVGRKAQQLADGSFRCLVSKQRARFHSPCCRGAFSELSPLICRWQ